MGKSGETSHSIKVLVNIFVTERNPLISANLLYEMAKTRMDGGKEKKKDLGVPDIS